eukprot:CAMPEP_0198680682 /NCGR_PEP_ID=MMETSP1468-20131203/5323_1 /TAXON_ID=1461545 /ORGANISM="Mantoniella sp, Strain CCMP1436" /LENGTH=177 /DNA_ID=CAMNT_0044421317 /DNA_START=177 /DNA_END=710 /DNA_ORIENTATION=+
MAPPPVPGGRKGGGGDRRGGRGSGGGGYKGRMGKRFKKQRSKDGSDKPPKKNNGLGLLAVVGFFGAMLGLVSCVALKERDEKRGQDDSLRRRLSRKPITFSEHAACRMDCRHVTREHVAATLATGAVSARHSTPGARPCPRWALEQDGVRAVWAECRDETKLVTVIDTVTDHPCGTC